jgi:1,4-dihydroxy-2-naphthoate octaprenyltransferase
MIICIIIIIYDNYNMFPIFCKVFVCTAPFHNTGISPYSYTGLGMCVCTICLSFQCLRLCIFNNADVYTDYRFSLNTRSFPKWGKLSIGVQYFFMLFI